MYVPAGTGISEVGDIEVFADGDELHLFHLTLPNHDVVQHAVSTDGLSWKSLPAALRTGDPGEADDDQIWTMSVTQRGDRDYVMLYTSLARADHGRVQRTAQATSTDLIHWTKSPRNPVASADPKWYEADPAEWGAVSWRDPKPIRVGDRWFAAVCAREKSGPLTRRGCVGLIESGDLERWEVRPPLFAPRGYWDLECPQVVEIEGAYYLTAAIMEDRTQRYWRSDRFEGPYAIPPDGGQLAPFGHYAGRMCRWRDQHLFLCWHEPSHLTRTAGTPYPKPSTLQSDIDWTSDVRNPHGKIVPPPLVLTAEPDGRLARRSFPGWSAYRDHEPRSAAPRAATAFRERPTNGAWRIDANDGGMDALTMTESADHFWFEATITLDAARGGLVFRFEDDGSGYFLKLEPGSTTVSLQKWLGLHDANRGWFRYAEIQRARVMTPIATGEPIRVLLLVVGPYVECSLNGEVVIAAMSAERVGGPAGIWAESGAIAARDVRWSSMREPRHS